MVGSAEHHCSQNLVVKQRFCHSPVIVIGCIWIIDAQSLQVLFDEAWIVFVCSTVYFYHLRQIFEVVVVGIIINTFPLEETINPLISFGEIVHDLILLIELAADTVDYSDQANFILVCVPGRKTNCSFETCPEAR